MNQQERVVSSFENVLARWLSEVIMMARTGHCVDFHAGFSAALEAALLVDLGMPVCSFYELRDRVMHWMNTQDLPCYKYGTCVPKCNACSTYARWLAGEYVDGKLELPLPSVLLPDPSPEQEQHVRTISNLD